MKKVIFITISFIVVIGLSALLISKIEKNTHNRPITTTPVTTEKLEVVEWKNIEDIYINSSVKDIDSKFSILSSASNENPIHYVIYPVHVDNKYISTYGEEDYYKEYFKTYDALSSTVTQKHLSLSIHCDGCEILKVKNTSKIFDYKTIDSETVWIENSYHPNSLYIVKVKNGNDIFEILFK